MNEGHSSLSPATPILIISCSFFFFAYLFFQFLELFPHFFSFDFGVEEAFILKQPSHSAQSPLSWGLRFLEPLHGESLCEEILGFCAPGTTSCVS